jgi:hypothetical protein
VTTVLALACVAVIAVAVRALVVALPQRSRAAAPRESGDTRSAGDLVHVDRTIAIATSNAGDLHLRLRPILREVAAAGLRRRGVDLDGDPGAAEGLLGPVTWELVRADRPRPDDQFAPGLTRRELEVVLDDLEGLLR